MRGHRDVDLCTALEVLHIGEIKAERRRAASTHECDEREYESASTASVACAAVREGYGDEIEWSDIEVARLHGLLPCRVMDEFSCVAQ
jgi:hypothetical protein